MYPVHFVVDNICFIFCTELAGRCSLKGEYDRQRITCNVLRVAVAQVTAA